MYNKRTWLNKEDSPSTGNVIAFDGKSLWRNKEVDNTFLVVSDCFVSAKLSKTDDDSIGDFIYKIKLLRNEIDLFINYLEKTYK